MTLDTGQLVNSRMKEGMTVIEPQEHVIQVYRMYKQDEGEVWKVDPGVVRARGGDTVKWRPKETDVTIYFPAGEVFLADRLTVSSGREESLSVKLDAAPGEYRYAVFCHSGDDFAVGSTHPIIIVERGD